MVKENSISYSRLQWLDGLKGMTIVFVVFNHVVESFEKNGLFITASNVTNNDIFQRLAILVHEFIGSYHMPLFICLSGFAFSLAYMDANGEIVWRKYRSQIANLILLYFIHSILYWTIKKGMSAFVNEKVSISDLLFLPIKHIQHLWYLYVLVVLYVIMHLFYNKVDNKWTFLLWGGVSMIFHASGSAFPLMRSIYYFFFFTMDFPLKCKIF